MEVKEFLQQNEVVVSSTAKELDKMLKNYIDKGDYDKSFRKLLVIRSGEPMSAKAFLNFIKDNESKIEDIHSEVTDLRSAICYVINEVIINKETYVQEKTAQRIVASTTVPDYYYKGKITDIPVDIFETVEGEANKADKDLYKCFCNAGEHIVFTSKEMTKLIMQNNDGSLAFGNDLTSMSEGSLYDCICKSMKTDFIAYKQDLISKVAALNSDDLDIEEQPTPVIEKIFLEEVPCSFRHIVNIFKRFKTNENNEMHFEGFVVKPNKKVVDHFDFDSFITALSKNFQKMTRGALKHQNEYKAFSNRDDEAAVTHWTTPSKDCWKKAMMPEKWKQFFSGKASPRMLARVLWYIGAMQDANNTAEQALIISDGGGTGKSTLMEVLYKLFPENFFGFITNSTLDDRKDFALSERKTYEHHCLVLDEYDGKSINSPVFKNLIGTKTPISMPVKNRQAIEHNFKGTKMIVLSNEISVLETHAFRRRVIPVSFSINHKGKDAFAKKDIQELIETGKDFLNFCYRVYKTCKCIKSNGEYYVLSPENEEKFKNGEDIDFKAEVISMKAISNDPEVSEFFNVHDYEDSDLSIDFQEFIANHFELTDNEDDVVSARQLLEALSKLYETDEGREELTVLFEDCIKTIRLDDGTMKAVINTHKKSWWLFTQALTSYGFIRKTQRDNGLTKKVWGKMKVIK